MYCRSLIAFSVAITFCRRKSISCWSQLRAPSVLPRNICIFPSFSLCNHDKKPLKVVTGLFNIILKYMQPLGDNFFFFAHNKFGVYDDHRTGTSAQNAWEEDIFARNCNFHFLSTTTKNNGSSWRTCSDWKNWGTIQKETTKLSNTKGILFYSIILWGTCSTLMVLVCEGQLIPQHYLHFCLKPVSTRDCWVAFDVRADNDLVWAWVCVVVCFGNLVLDCSFLCAFQNVKSAFVHPHSCVQIFFCEQQGMKSVHLCVPWNSLVHSEDATTRPCCLWGATFETHQSWDPKKTSGRIIWVISSSYIYIIPKTAWRKAWLNPIVM